MRLLAIISTIIASGCGAAEVAKTSIQLHHANKYADNVEYENKAQNYIEKFSSACGVLCQKRPPVDFLAGDMLDRSTPGFCAVFKGPKEVRPNNYLLIDRNWWLDPTRGLGDRLAESASAWRFLLVSHELMHCYLNIGHRSVGLMTPRMTRVYTENDVIQLIKDEVEYIRSGGKYYNKNFDGSSF